MRELENTHDLRLPQWGPYTKDYVGISHLPDLHSGLRFDLSVFPGYYRGRVAVPNVKWESMHYPWEAAPDLSYFAYRHELEWKDQVYTDVAYVRLDDNSTLIRTHLVNRTDLPQTLVLHYMASLRLPPLRPNGDEVIRPGLVDLPAGAVWLDALSYDDLIYARPRPTDNLVPDGMFRGEVRASGFVGGSGVGRGFGADAGDRLAYILTTPAELTDAALLIRYRLPGATPARLRLQGLVEQEISLPVADDFGLVEVPLGAVAAGPHRLTLTSLGGAAVELDGFVLCPAAGRGAVTFREVEWDVRPEMLPGPTPNSLRLRYRQLPDVEYGLAWDWGHFQVRQLLVDELDRFLPRAVHEHVSNTLRYWWEPQAHDGHFANAFLRPIPLEPKESRVLHGLVCSGDSDLVQERLASFGDPARNEAAYRAGRARRAVVTGNPDGAGYEFSQERMAAVTLSNLVYPLYVRGTHVRHYTPGRWWNCLYTWDSGFVGLGLLESDPERAVDCLNAYMTEPGDQHAAFIHHGSPVPVQHYLFHELWNRTRDRGLLAHFYPRLKQYHEFLAGRLGSSTTRSLPSNLLKTWDYFYNSGGWDDYHAQVVVHREGLEDRVAPASNTSHAIRTAKILRRAAMALGRAEDVAAYDDDIRVFTEALQSHAWDDEAGYFSYVVHDEHGRPTGFLRDEDGVNLNRGLDGAYPLEAGICTPEQERRLLAHLADPNELWTPIGLTAVDRSAPYYRLDGYWNGAVWMPHQWFFWKTCLDLGQDDLAWQIARTGLDVWKREVDASYNCYEHFIVATGRGAGWHQFTGLSSPVLSWQSAYFRPGRLTTGFEAWVEDLSLGAGNSSLEAHLTLDGRSGRDLSVVACLAPAPDYRATWNGELRPTKRLTDGALSILLPAGEQGTLRVVPA